jgi:hypothetical protein
MLVSFLASSSNLKMKVTYFTSVDFQQSTGSCIPVDGTLHNHGCENLKSFRWSNLGLLHSS